MTQQSAMFASIIIIINHNYARFVAEAIDSALAQTYREIEVIVCDDASTDDSGLVIGRYGDRIRALRNAVNAGQAAAMNAGFAASRGEVVLFLDSDDVLAPEAIECCVRRMSAGVAKVQFALQCIDAEGRRTGWRLPFLMHEGDVRPIIRRFGAYAGPPASGNCYRRSAIERYFPLPAAQWARAADTPPFILAAFNGRVVNAGGVLGSYRVHAADSAAPGSLGNIPTRYAEALRVDAHRRSASLALLAAVDGESIEGPFLPTPWNLRTRAMSWRLERERHPFPDDTAAGLLRLQARALRECPGYTGWERRLAQAWLVALLVIPRAWARRVAKVNSAAWTRRWLDRAHRWT